MDSVKPKRGRPIGTGIDDSKILAAIADALLANPKLRPTTAYKQIAHKSSEASIRRIQAKWNAQRELLLAAAEQRKAARLEAERQAIAAQRSTPGLAIANLVHRNSVAGQLMALKLAHQNPTMRAIQEMQKTSLFAQLKALEEHSAFARIRKLTEDSSLSRMMKAMDESPTMRMIRKMENSPLIQKIKAQQEAHNRMLGVGLRYRNMD
jgi:hypothetical protein